MSNIDYAALNAEFGLLGQVTFKPGPGGLPAVEVRNPQASATLLLQGAHLIDWTPIGADPVIWLSKDAKFAPGNSVRGGVPVCWPWFGPHPSEATFPAHGFALGWQPGRQSVARYFPFPGYGIFRSAGTITGSPPNIVAGLPNKSGRFSKRRD